MDFFSRQDQARRNTKWLVVYFVLSVLLTIALVYVAFAFLFLRGAYDENGLPGLWNWQFFAGVTAGTLFVILIGNITKIAALSQGGAAVARLLGGQPIQGNTNDPDERKLLNVVEEMAIASGTPVPEVYLLENEDAINAFAAGKSPQDAVIGVTRGCIKLLSRDELQGVMAHEFSHILNGDMRLNLRLMGLVHGLLCIAIVGRVLLYSGARRHYHRRYMLGAKSKSGGNPLPLLGLALLVIGSIGMFFGRLIKAAVSREREFLADASAVQFTRHPGGIAGALKKIGGWAQGSRLQSAHAEEASHFFFGNGLAKAWFRGLATHPPLPERIKAIEPSWDGTFPKPEPREALAVEASREPQRTSNSRPRSVRPPALPDLLGGRASGFSPQEPVPAHRVLDHVGAPTANHLDFAVMLVASLPENVATAVRDPLSAVSVVYALLLSEDESMRNTQIESLSSRLDRGGMNELRRLLPSASGLEPSRRLPVIELALPALHQLSPAQYRAFADNLRFLIESDRELDLFEYALQKLVVRHLVPHFQPPRKAITQYYSINPLLPDAAVLLSALAHVGHPEPDLARQAFDHGAASIRAGGDLSFLPLSKSTLHQIDQALDRLGQAAPQIKKVILQACVHTVAADGVVAVREGELLRAIADALDCPVPPLLQSV